ncbi:MAG: cyclic nucleotide-binding domain-containing protein [Acidobacteriota bacterium]|nr:MAG: cyclic nucleotide-binding domain-containing protein [Acidobacteriota bacterium]
MKSKEPVSPHERFLYLAGLLTLSGLATAVVYTLRSTPYTMILFLGLGQTLIVAGIVIFVAVVVSDIRNRLQSVVEKRFPAGETIFEQGDFPDRLYLIGSGQADVIRRDGNGTEVLLAQLGPGEVFGEMGVLGNVPRTATVRASTELEVLSIHRTYFSPLISYLPTFRNQILSEYRRRTEAMGRPVPE